MRFKFHPSKMSEGIDRIVKYCHNKKVEMIVEIKQSKGKRSMSQNNYYWGVVLPILGNDFGYTGAEMHQILGSNFLSYHKEGHTFVKSTTELTTIEFEGYMDKIRQWAFSEHGIHIPVPNEITTEMLMELSKQH